MTKQQFLENDIVIHFSRNTGGSQPIQYTADIEIKNKKVYVTGRTAKFYQPPKEYFNSLLRESEIESLFINCEKYGKETYHEICSHLMYMFYI